MKILVTGGAGFIGSHLVDKLIEKGHSVAVIDNLSTGKKENINKKAEFYNKDIRKDNISKIIKKEDPEVIFHYAAQIDVRKSTQNPIEDGKINILGSLNVIESFLDKATNPKHFFFASTGGAIYGDADQIPTKESYKEEPLSPYGVAKLSVEKYLNFYKETHNLKYTAFRFSNVYGPRQNPDGEAGVAAIFTDQIFSGEQPIIFGDGKQTRDFVYVKDVVRANMMALNKGKGGTYNISTGKETSVNEIFKYLVEFTGKEIKEKHGDPKKGEQRRSCLDYSKAKKELGWEPKYDIKKGLKETVEWFNQK